MSDLLSPDELAERFGVDRRVVLEWSRKYHWPRTKVGRHIWFTEEQYERILASHEVRDGEVVNRDGRTHASKARSA